MQSNLLKRPLSHAAGGSTITMLHDISWDTTEMAYTGLRVVDLKEGVEYEEHHRDRESCVVLLAGRADVKVSGVAYENLGRRNSPFDRVPTDSVYVPAGHPFRVRARTSLSIAIAYAPTTEGGYAPRLIRAEDNRVERRGKYQNQRLVHNILSDQDQHAHRLLVVEVFTEGGHWSSYPPHKHDRDALPDESFLEEIYYHEIDPPQGFVLQRVYTDQRDIDETFVVHHRDVVLVPRGYHPVGVPDGYASYYLNVMAGPVRIWKFYNDPAHEWILKRA
ncbi:5-deoxy-glucuronate isomerase [Alicyclobacillus mali]|uniref:5-deoxy-glucuronate isomerase n=1 Tax=Alicyclobacillus mali (ex Roth et al. 2021) TaxID=1123961 RepID=A0ABS0F0L0_9BACL|nr:5-deoxy-glucuronate isomerase [Alicyclobacillus mali (ex Roth et al. 2021)]MBF8376843.1 5-deoxy-glucuronate isomerase [Alicyclobacillus mali (ex Roth et al. 2021)]